MAIDAKLAFDQLTMSNNGLSRLRVMIGANTFVKNDEENFVGFKFMRGAKNKANYIKIALNGKDLYDVEFGYIRAGKYTVRSVTNDMYFEDLKEFFERETCLYLSL